MGTDVEVLARIPVTIPFTDVSFNIVISDIIVVSWIVMAVIILWAYLATRKMKNVPTGLQVSAEIVVETVNNLVKSTMSHHWRKFAPYIGTLLLYLALANTLGVFLFTKPLTRDLSIPAALAIMTITLVVGAGIKFKGIKGWLKSFIEPMPIMLPFNILEYFIKPLSLCMRLFGNIFAAYVLMHMIIKNIPLIFPSVACLYFDLFDGGLQAFVFVFLTTLYVAEAVEVEEQ